MSSLDTRPGDRPAEERRRLQPDPEDLEWHRPEDRMPELYACWPDPCSKRVAVYDGEFGDAFDVKKLDFGTCYVELDERGNYHWKSCWGAGWTRPAPKYWAEIPATWSHTALKAGHPVLSAADPPSP